jgi:hypothetical protein
VIGTAVLEDDTVATRARSCRPAWQAVARSEVTDAVLEWPPDLFALTDVVLARAEVGRCTDAMGRLKTRG